MASYCGHCHHFEPIYDKTSKIIKSNPFFKDYTINFEKYDFDESKTNDYKTEHDFGETHPEIINNVEGFPTVFVKIDGLKGDGGSYSIIQHSVEKGDGENGAVNEFIDNIMNEVKTVGTNGKEKFLTVQHGGSNEKGDCCKVNNNFDKYIDYKAKYLMIKKVKIL